MHHSPSPSRSKSSSSLESPEQQQVKTIIFASTIILLVMTTISCFATSWVVTALVDWPVGSVVEKRSSLGSSSSSSSSQKFLFSYLHAALQRDDHCHLETQEQLDKALGTFVKKELQNVLTKVNIKKTEIEASVSQEQEKIAAEEKKQQAEEEEGNENTRQKRRRRRPIENKKSWNVPEFSLRASKFKSHLLEGFYDPRKKKAAAEKLLHASKEEQQQQLRVTSIAAVATSFRNVMNFMHILAQPIEEGYQLVFARNTVDKLLYQLRNFEPLTHALVSPPWNPILVEEGEEANAGGMCNLKNTKKLLLGMSSVSRATNYLFKTVSSLISSLSPSELKDITLVILDADVPAGKNSDLQNVKAGFERYIQDGTIEIITREEGDLHHPEMRRGASSLTHRWGDDNDRIWWRSKQVLDVSYLMSYAEKNSARLLWKNKNQEIDADDSSSSSSSSKFCGGYFLMLEDDIVSTKHFSTKILKWVKTALFDKKDTKWTVASFYNPWPVKDKEKLPPYKFFGVIGQLFRIHELPTMVEFLKKNFDQSPLDWLFVDYLKKMNGQMVVHTPSMFQHKGYVSSLKGKTQDGTSVDFQP